MNIVQVQDQLKNFSQDQLVREMQAPSGNTPQYLVLSEIMRRQRMQADSAAQQSKGEPQATVADEAIAAAGVPQGGIADMARALAPKTDMAENTGIQAMAKGGPVKKMAKGGAANTDPAIIAMANRVGMSVEEYLASVGEEEAARLMQGAAARATRARMTGMEPQQESFLQRVNPSYTEDLTGRFPVSGDSEPGPDYLGESTYDGGAPPSRPGAANADMTSISEAVAAGKARGGRGGIIDAMLASGAPITSADMYLPPERLIPAAGTPFIEDRGAEAIAARNELLGGLVDRFDQQAMMEPGAGRAGFATGEGESEYDRIMRAAAERTAPGMGQGLPMGPAEIPAGGLARQAQFEPLYPESPEAPRKFYQPPPAPDRSGTMGTNGVPDVAGALAAIPETLATEVRIGPDGTVTMVPPAKEPVGRVDRDQQGIAAIPTPAEIAAEAAATQPAPPGGGGGGAGAGGAGGGGGGAGAGGMSSYEQELMNALGRREKAAEQDKWLALAQVGLGMMSSTQPTLAGAIGEAGLKGVEAARSARDQYDKDRLDLLGAIEQSRLARAKASARGGSGVSGLKLKDYLGQMKAVADVAKSQLDLVTGGADPTMAIEMALDAGDNARALEIRSAYQQALAAQTEYMNTVRTVGGLDPMAAEEDDTNVDAMDE